MNPHNIEIVQEDARALLASMTHLASGPKNCASGACTVSNAAERGQTLAKIWQKHRSELAPVLNADTTDTGYADITADLKRILLLHEALFAFKRTVLPLTTFASRFDSVPLEGTDVMGVPYYPLKIAASSNFGATGTPSAGYVFDQPTTTGIAEVTISTRKYQPMNWTAWTQQRQPFFLSANLLQQNMEKLGYDVLLDVLSAVTAANFANSVPSGGDAFCMNSLVGLSGLALKVNKLYWPVNGRSLILNAQIDATLKQDPTIQLALNIGGTEVLRGGYVPRQIGGFNYYTIPELPDNGQNLAGVAVFKSAILFGSAPIAPTDAVARQLSVFDIVPDPATGIALVHREWGNPTYDETRRIVECAYGYNVGLGDALVRITNP